MSVDTYARKANLSAYRKFQEQGVEILVAKSLAAQAYMVRLEVKNVLLYLHFLTFLPLPHFLMKKFFEYHHLNVNLFPWFCL